MSEVAAPDRARLLRSKRDQLNGIVTSRKRKLREYYAVCDATEPVPKITYESLDAPPTNPDEARFLDLCDILQDRFLDESNLPTRRFLRSETSKQISPIRKENINTTVNDASRKAAKIQRDGSRTRKSRAATPSTRSDAGQSTIEENGILMQRSTSTGSQTDLPADSAVVLNKIVEEVFQNATQPKSSALDDSDPTSSLEINRIQSLQSAPNSPGVDPRRAMPILGEDAVNLGEPLLPGLGSHDGEPHKAHTAHLPPREIQEERLQEAERMREQKHLSIILPPRDSGRAVEPLSSPSSTIGAHSATTPALHETSTDTSPENEIRYDVDAVDKDEEPETPLDFNTPEEESEKKRHDRIHQAQVEIAGAQILASHPIMDDEEEREVEAPESINDQDDVNSMENEPNADITDGRNKDPLTTEARGVIQDAEEDHVEVENLTQDEAMTGVEKTGSGPKETKTMRKEVADSEGEDQSPILDAMDVDALPIQVNTSEKLASTEGGADVPPILPNSLELATSLPVESITSCPSTIDSAAKNTPVQPPPSIERMQTRVSSGAMRHKSVSEILGEIPRPNTTSHSERNIPKGDSDSTPASTSPSRSATPLSPGSRGRSLIDKVKDKERSKLSTVIFAKQPSRPTSLDKSLTQDSQASRDAKNDYFLPLFVATATNSSRGVPSLDNLLATAHKTITTSNAFVPLNENQATKILKRIYGLQSTGKWSLRQPKRSDEPQRQTSHWDVVIQEAKWMRTDFREERKWKMTVARNLAFACAEWHESSQEDKKLLQVNAISPPVNDQKDVEMGEASSQLTHPTPDLVTSGESSLDEDEEDPRLDLGETVAPTALFGLSDDDVVFGLRRSPTTDRLLKELPLYGAPLAVPSTEASRPDIDPDRYWRREALPLSKYVEGRIELKPAKPPKKKSRFDYSDTSDEEDEVPFGEARSRTAILPPESMEVALFNPEYKPIRDRIHAGHQFRPPSEYPMPLQSFFENRIPSQWTYAEDDALKTHVRDYSYNWSLISNMLTSASMFSSGAERRTPWECFERWICLEGLPADMQKTQYFRAYNSRVEAANRNVLAQAAQQPQQANAQGQLQQPRRRTTASIRVERRRQQKYLSMVDAMRKLAKKKELAISKQAHAANLAAMRKANEVPQQRNLLRTPQELSRLKHEQGERMRVQYETLLAQRQQNNARALIQARLQNQGSHPGLPNGSQQQRSLPVNGQLPNGAPANGQNLAVPTQNRPRGPLPAQMAGQMPLQNGGLRIPQPLMNGVPQAPMQGMQGQLPLPNPALDVGLVTQAHQISQQQRQAIQMRQQGQIPVPGQVHNSPPRNMNGISPPNFPMQNGNMMQFPNPNGVSSPGGGPSPSQGQAGSPRMGHPQQNPMLPHAKKIEETLRAKFPTASTDQIMNMVTEQIHRSLQQRQGIAQSAMNAAAGGSMGMANGMSMNGMANGRIQNGAESSPQMYAQMLRQQQEAQQKSQAQAAVNAAANGQGHQRTASSNSGN